MSFYREQIVKKPRKQYVCYLCGKNIDGVHVYIAGMCLDGEFCTNRAHVDCHEKQQEMCGKCDDRCGCQGDVVDCFFEDQQAELGEGG